MTHSEAIEQAQKHLHLIGKEFRLPDGETESIKTVVPWDEGDGNWQLHVCFFGYGEESGDGIITHMNLDDFLSKYKLFSRVEEN
jgi:hypothetical protein